MPQIELTIRNEKTASYRVITAIFLITHFLFFAFFLIYPNFFALSLAALLSLVAYVFVRWRLKKQHRTEYFLDTQGLLFVICAFWWLLLQKFVVVAICIFLGLMYNLAMRKAKFIFTPQKILVYTPFKKYYNWQSLVQVILKDGILTLDFKNNKLIQVSIENSLNVSETDINKFFGQQLNQ